MENNILMDNTPHHTPCQPDSIIQNIALTPGNIKR